MTCVLNGRCYKSMDGLDRRTKLTCTRDTCPLDAL